MNPIARPVPDLKDESSATAELADFTAVIPAGGSGTRLWPLSRRSSPKFLHDLTGSGRSLLQSTVDRVRPLVGERVMVVTGVRHAEAVREQLPGLAAHEDSGLLVEPSPRDSMPAIGLAAAVLERRVGPEAILGSFAADQVIPEADLPRFHDCLRQAVVSARGGALVTLGIDPTYPATGFGYIQLGEQAALPGAPSVRRVAAFVEKPALEQARDYVDSGEYLWNAGMFVVQAGVLLELLAMHHPQMVQILRQIAAHPESLEERWGSLTKISIDHAVAEPASLAGRVSVVPAPVGWDDVGDFASLATLLAESGDHPGLRVLGSSSDVVTQDSTGIVAAHGGRTVVTLGVDDIVVVDTPDALLVTNRAHCQDVRSVVATLQQLGREDLT